MPLDQLRIEQLTNFLVAAAPKSLND
jgi:hypothetical protein